MPEFVEEERQGGFRRQLPFLDLVSTVIHQNELINVISQHVGNC